MTCRRQRLEGQQVESRPCVDQFSHRPSEHPERNKLHGLGKFDDGGEHARSNVVIDGAEAFPSQRDPERPGQPGQGTFFGRWLVLNRQECDPEGVQRRLDRSHCSLLAAPSGCVDGDTELVRRLVSAALGVCRERPTHRYLHILTAAQLRRRDLAEYQL